MCIDLETCERTADDWVIGYYPYPSPHWFLVREGGAEYSEHETHNEAMRDALETDGTVRLFHEANGGGCLGSFDESPYGDDDECF